MRRDGLIKLLLTKALASSLDFGRPLKFNHLSIILLITFLMSVGRLWADPGEEIILPDIGDPASQVLSVNQEAELGEIIQAQINQHLPVSTDPEIRNYLQSLGTRLIAAGVNSDFPYYFNLIFDQGINAFAMPGGIVAINSGLFILSQTESELASVIAHEISHISQRHIARRYSREQKLSVVNTIALLGSVLAAVYGSADAGMAAATVTSEQMLVDQLAYSRAFEQEADRIGMALLVNARLNPFGMPRFFERLHEYSKVNQNNMPEFLRTHPLTMSRISDSVSRAQQYEDQPYHETSTLYHYARARTIAISTEPKRLVSEYRQLVKQQPSNINRYIYGIALSRMNHGQAAINQLKQINTSDDEHFPVAIALAQAHIAHGTLDPALDILLKLDELYPRNEAVIYYLSTALMEKKQFKSALDKLDTLESSITSNPSLEHLRARAADGAGQSWRSHEALSNYDLMHARFNPAMEHLVLALRQPGIDKHSIARIEAKKGYIRELRQKLTY